MQDQELTDQEKTFIDALLDNGGNIKEAAVTAGYAGTYAYALRKRLTKPIIEATKDYFATNAMRAAQRVVLSIDHDMPNAINLNAALALLDRVGITKKDVEAGEQVVKANIFILPAKDNATD